MQTTEPRQLLTARQAAHRLGIRLHRLYELTRAGALSHVRLGRTVRIDPNALDRFIENGGTQGESGE